MAFELKHEEQKKGMKGSTGTPRTKAPCLFKMRKEARSSTLDTAEVTRQAGSVGGEPYQTPGKESGLFSSS